MSDASLEELAALEVFADIPAEDLMALAADLMPLYAAAGEVLMRQGDRAESFIVVTCGRVAIRHVDDDGQIAVTELSPGRIIGEIALLRNALRTATVIAQDDVRGYLGYADAFERMLDIPVVAERMVRTARQRLAADLAPIRLLAVNGIELMLRPVLPGDAERFQSSGVFSRETLHRRFLSSYALTEARLAYLFEVDYVDHFVWVLTSGVDGPVIGDARFVRDKDEPTSAEIAITVADAYQCRGIGTLLLAALAIAARTDGIERFYALVLYANDAARALGSKLAVRWGQEEPGVVSTTFEVSSVDTSSLEEQLRRQILHAARQVIHAFD
ncbi:MAG: GNAT family N-acetyltransferase [Mycobacteriaceae bacterium]|nr:GNAT family N-acetyltransferase [Mycobacteriaceae bacterium]